MAGSLLPVEFAIGDDETPCGGVHVAISGIFVKSARFPAAELGPVDNQADETVSDMATATSGTTCRFIVGPFSSLTQLSAETPEAEQSDLFAP